MATIHSLPVETLDHIFDILISSFTDALTWPSLVCRAWRDPAQRTLHAVVRLSTGAQTRLWRWSTV